jgi:hypothetical protein
MKQARQRSSTPRASRPAQTTEAEQSKSVQKDWTVRVDVRLPHKIGQPLGSSTACDGGGDGGGQ